MEFGRRTLSHHVVLTFFKRVRPTGLLKRKKTDTSTHLESQDGENGLLAQLARAPALHAGGREFESLTVHNADLKKGPSVSLSGLVGPGSVTRGVAQLVARLLWEQEATGSSPVTPTTMNILFIFTIFDIIFFDIFK